MNKITNNIKTKSLSQPEKDTMWQGISHNLEQKNNLSIFNLVLTKNPMISIIVALVLVFSGSVMTVQAADNAKPGDALYTIDRAVEDFRISIASKEKKDVLKLEFAEERVLEMQTVIDENLAEVSKLKDIYARIYANDTVVHTELASGKQFKFILKTIDQKEIVKIVAERFQTSAEVIRSIIRFETVESNDDEPSIDNSDDEPSLSNTGEIEESTQVILDYMIKVRNELSVSNNAIAVTNIDQMIGQIKYKLSNLPEDIKVEIELEEEDGKTKFKIEFETDDHDDLKDKKEEYRLYETDQPKIEIESGLYDNDDYDDSNDDDSDNHDYDDENIYNLTAPVMGSNAAVVTIVEFSDLQCPFCKRFSEDTLPLIKKNYIDTGKVKIVFKNYALSFHSNAHLAAEAALCAHEQGRFWDYHDLLFANQHALDELSLREYARQLGLDTDKFNTCEDTHRYSNMVDTDFKEGTAKGVRGTPTFFINGKMLNGSQPYEQFERMIKEAIDDYDDHDDDKNDDDYDDEEDESIN
jgi:predicted DsbA family dithiol-disulfide isomerase